MADPISKPGEEISVAEANQLMLKTVARPPHVNQALFDRAVGNAVLAGMHNGVIKVTELPTTAQIDYAIALEQQKAKENRQMAAVATGAATAAAASTAAVGNDTFIQNVVDHMTLDAMLDGTDSFLRECGFMNSRENRMLIQGTHQKMTQIFAGDPRMQMLGTTFSIAAGVTIAGKDKDPNKLKAGVSATVEAIRNMTPEQRKIFEKHMKNHHAGDAADHLYDSREEFRDKLREEWRRQHGLDPKQAANPDEDRAIKQHFRDGIEHNSGGMMGHIQHFEASRGKVPTYHAGARPPMRQGNLTPKIAAPGHTPKPSNRLAPSFGGNT